MTLFNLILCQHFKKIKNKNVSVKIWHFFYCEQIFYFVQVILVELLTSKFTLKFSFPYIEFQLFTNLYLECV